MDELNDSDRIDDRVQSGLAQISNFWCPFVLPVVVMVFGKKNLYVRVSAVQALAFQCCYLLFLALIMAVVARWPDVPPMLVFGPSAILGITQTGLTVWGVYCAIVGKLVRYPVLFPLAIRLLGKS